MVRKMKLGKRRVYFLAYIDNVALVAENEGGIKCILERMEVYLDGGIEA